MLAHSRTLIHARLIGAFANAAYILYIHYILLRLYEKLQENYLFTIDILSKDFILKIWQCGLELYNFSFETIINLI